MSRWDLGLLVCKKDLWGQGSKASGYPGEEYSGQRAQPVQRPCSGAVPGCVSGKQAAVRPEPWVEEEPGGSGAYK